ncbi:hypothetical protein [Pseudomonas sp. RIT-PI-S]|uniref:hypothetical protein n=1 Tax=Pseudomonas sp. RIT-PI-S TaxID=3035295 RepID=UPI0021D92589|nr:hypothetical protein [Pseudomonas sp. RIT-PI-S]
MEVIVKAAGGGGWHAGVVESLSLAVKIHTDHEYLIEAQMIGELQTDICDRSSVEKTVAHVLTEADATGALTQYIACPRGELSVLAEQMPDASGGRLSQWVSPFRVRGFQFSDLVRPEGEILRPGNGRPIQGRLFPAKATVGTDVK